MTIINPKSIAGVTSITTPSGSDNLFTVHTNNTTERVRINNDGDVIVGSGITVSPDGDIFTTGVTTATTFVGALTGNVTGNVTGNISGGTVAGSTGTFSGDVKTTAATVNVKSGSSINTNSDTSAHGALHKNTSSGEFAVVSGGTGGNNHLTFYTSASAAPTEKVRITSSGSMGLGTNSPSDTLHVYHATDNLVARFESGDTGGGITLKDNTHVTSLLTTNGAFEIDVDQGGDISGETIAFKMSGSEKMRIDSSGRLLLGLTSSRGNYGNNTSGVDYKMQIEGTGATTSSLALIRNSNDANDGGIILGKTRATSVGGNTVVQAGDDIGTLSFVGADGTSLQFGADIGAEVESGVGNDDMPTALYFKTNSGSTSTTERMRITADGNTHFGSSGTLNGANTVSVVPSEGRISFGMDGRNSLVTGESGCYIFSGDGASGDFPAGELVLQSRSNENRDIKFATGSTPTVRGRFRGSDGDFFFGNDLGSITNLGISFREHDSGGHSYMEIGHGTTGAAYAYAIFRFGGSGTSIGQIAQNSSGNGVTFNTSSDYRLKTNEVLMTDGITRIKQLKPYKFEWKSDLGTKVDGFFAHEVSSIVPEAITGEKDAVETTYYEDEKDLPEGKSVGDIKETDRPVYQSIDHSKLVPLLTAALQEAVTKIEVLETRLNNAGIAT